MSTKKRQNSAPAPAQKPPVLHGDVFRAFVDEARSIGNEVAARREFMKERGLDSDFAEWCAAKRG